MMIPGELKSHLESGDFVLFLGAGVAKEAGIPAWRESLLQLADHLRRISSVYAAVMEEEAKNGRYLHAAESLYLAPMSDAKRADILQSVFGKAPTLTRRLKLLALTRCQGIVTTNFDRSLAGALVEVKRDLLTFTEADGDLVNARVSQTAFMLRLHGRIEVPETLIFADRHYRTLPERKAYVEFFRELFLNRNLIFFGFSFDDPVFIELVDMMSSAVRSVFKRSAFVLLPSSPSPSLAELFRKANIQPIVYPQGGDHQAGYDLFDSFRGGPPAVPPETFEALRVKSHLATAYARAKAKAFSADRERVLSGLLIPLLAPAGKNASLPLEDFLRRSEEALALPRIARRDSLMRALELLESDGLVVLEGDKILIGDVPSTEALEADSKRLLSGVFARAQARHGYKIPARAGPAIQSAIIAALTLDGLHLAYNLIKGNPLEERRLLTILDQAIEERSLDQASVESVKASVLDLMLHPDPEEEAILSNVSVVVFTTAILLVDPLLADQAASPFELGAYVDASVLLPWLCTGHPLEKAYEGLLKAFIPGKVRVLDGYLNEILSHRRLALDAIKVAGLEDRDRVRRYAQFFELHNINTFLGGYAATLASGFAGDFRAYLDRYAPYESEAELGKYLRTRGLVVEGTSLNRERSLFGEIKSAMKDQWKIREDVVIEHDARQIEILQQEYALSTCPYFITADKTLVGAVATTSARSIIKRILLPHQAVYLAQLSARGPAAIETFSRALWGLGGDSATRIKKYYTDRVLKEYEHALVAEIPLILEAMFKEFKAEGTRLDEIDPRSEGENERIRTFNLLDRFEPKFYQHLMEAKKRSGLA